MLDGYGDYAKSWRTGGLPYVKYTGNGDNGGFETGVAKFLASVSDDLVSTLGLEVDDVVLFIVSVRRLKRCTCPAARLRFAELARLRGPRFEEFWRAKLRRFIFEPGPPGGGLSLALLESLSLLLERSSAPRS